MQSQPAHATWRIRRHFDAGGKPSGYRHTLELLDEASGRPLASCALLGRAVFGEHAIDDAGTGTWRLRANRKVMPSRWTLGDPSGSIALHFDQDIVRKLLNPTHRALLSVVDPLGAVVYRLIDPRSTVPQRLPGLGPDEWALMQDDTLVAKLVRLAPPGKAAKGPLARLKALLAPSDRGLVGLHPAHALPAPAALAMVMLADELVDESIG